MINIIPYYYFGAMISIFLLFFIRHNNSFDSKINHYFIAATLCAMILIVVDAVESILAMRQEPSIWRVVCSSVGYVLRPMAIYFVLRIAIRRVSSKIKQMTIIPLIIDIIVSFSALFCDLFFGYDANNQFYRGPLGYTPFIISGIYGILLIMSTFKLVKSSHKEEALFLLVIALNGVIGTALETFYQLDAILPSCIAVSVSFYYMFFHTYQNSRDVLTGALLRRRFYLDSDKWEAQLSGVISIDLNELKQVNDRKGHIEGDKAIVTLASTIHAILPRQASLYRTGGDEFLILCKRLKMSDMEKIALKIREEMSKTPYSCAVGIAEYHSEEGLDAACNKADAMMYEDKIHIKGEKYRIKYRTSERV
ncbi:MAG: GGDEF domain-containing protein [bacterium]|nr:GGDEF domain-containing protein [bacterium]